MISYSKTLMFFLLMGCLVQEVFAAYTRINDFRYCADVNGVRVVFDASGPIDYSIQEVPNKIIINIKDAKLIGLLNKTWLHKTPINSVQDKQDGKDLQLTLSLKKSIKLKHFVLQKPYRLVLNFTETKIVADINAPSTSGVIEEKATDYDSGSSRDVMIVIDPGHGGKDPGAIGFRGTREKDVALAVSLVLQNTINKTQGFHCVLTRKGDYYITLRERLGIAHRYKADMFIAIHADAYKYRDSHGVSVFALSQRGATSEAARWLAEKENESELGQTILDKNVLLRSVLIDLAQAATISASLEIGDMLLQELMRITHLHSSRIEQAAFVVLKSPDIPSLLVETGFISDPHEEAKLRDSRYQQKIANCLATGITTYFIRRPPQGTYLAKIKRKFKPRSA